jgi:hypothetical protein
MKPNQRFGKAREELLVDFQGKVYASDNYAIRATQGWKNTWGTDELGLPRVVSTERTHSIAPPAPKRAINPDIAADSMGGRTDLVLLQLQLAHGYRLTFRAQVRDFYYVVTPEDGRIRIVGTVQGDPDDMGLQTLKIGDVQITLELS